MNKAERNSLFTLPIVILIGIGLAWAGSQGSSEFAGIPVFAIGVGLAFALNWLAFIPAYLKQTEKYFDLMGGISFITVTVVAVILSPVVDGRSWLLLSLIVVWAFGFGLEVLADWQKSKFKADPANQVRFINTGLWAWSRHPNYFGEIVLWIGVAVVAVPVLQGWGWLTLISPVFIALLLTRISGIPMLEKRADEKWGGQPEYEAYKAGTSILIPRPPK